MTAYAIGDSVVIVGRGPGVVTDIIGGPAGKLCRVTLSEAVIWSTSYTCDDSELIPAAAVPTYAPGDTVMYQGRLAEVTAYDPSNGSVEIVAVPTLPNPAPPVNIESRVVLSATELYLQQIKG